ncbi:hypothetical protein CHUAL_011078, partial [Chamberlinius hualienensis]
MVKVNALHIDTQNDLVLAGAMKLSARRAAALLDLEIKNSMEYNIQTCKLRNACVVRMSGQEGKWEEWCVKRNKDAKGTDDGKKIR